MKIAVSGANGYIGSRLVLLLRQRNIEVVHLTRSAPSGPHARPEQWIAFDLSKPSIPSLPPDVDAVIHLAFNAQLSSAADSANEVESAVGLLDAAEKVGAVVVFVSSQTARDDAPTLYGRTKAEIEKLVIARGGCNVRPGQVYGGEEKGLFGLLVNVVKRLPLLPAFLPAPKVQPVHVDDLAEALLRAARQSGISGRTLAVAASEPVTFTYFLQAIGTYRLDCKRLFVPTPVWLIRAVVWVLGAERSSRLGVSRLLSLFDLPLMSSRADLETLGLVLRALEHGMRIDGDAGKADRDTSSDAALFSEGHAMLAYLLKRPPEAILVDRYIQAIRQCRDGKSMNLPDFVIRHPMLISLLDDRAFLASARGQDFSWRLDAAMWLAEASPGGAQHYIGLGRPAGFFRYGLQLLHAVSMDIFWRIARACAMPIFLRAVIDRSFR